MVPVLSAATGADYALTGAFLYVISFGWLICVAIGTILGSNRGRGFAGLFLSAMFGPLGVLMVLLFDKKPSVGSGDHLTDMLLKRPPTSSAGVFPDRPIATRNPDAIPHSNVEALLDLKRLLDAGVISAAEYEERKLPLLNPRTAPRATDGSSVRYNSGARE